MNLQYIYELCNYISNKEKSGNAFTPQQFNYLNEALNRSFFKKKVEESGYFDMSRQSYVDHIRGSKNLHKFIENETLSGGGSTSYTFAYPLGAHDDDNDVLIEIISEAEYHDRQGDSVLLPSASAPVMLERGDNLAVFPTITNVSLSYYRFPNTPVLDYYINTSGVIQFLSEGATHTWTTGETDSTGTVRTTGDPDWTSLTAELEYNEDMHEDFMNEILSRVGIRLHRPELAQYAEMLKNEQKQM